MQHSVDCHIEAPDAPQRSRNAFTLIELLVVIAIIGILAAILFPVFGTIEENAREGNTMAHMHAISSALELYKLDNKTYPPVLFAYACDSAASSGDAAGYAGDQCADTDTMANILHDPSAPNELVGLYPEYVPDWHTFTCDDDNNKDANGAATTTTADGAGSGPQPDYLGTDGALHGADGSSAYPFRSYFTDDAFDVNPEVLSQYNPPNYGNPVLSGTAGSGAGGYVYVLRYQTNWTSMCSDYSLVGLSSTNPGTAPCDINYTRQLRWQNPPSNTFVTATTYHVPPANRLIALYQGGYVQTVSLGNDKQTGYPDAGEWLEPPNPSPDVTPQPVPATQPSVGPIAASGACTTGLPTGSSTQCNYSNATFWQFNYGNQ